MAEMTDFLTFVPTMPRPEHLDYECMVMNYDRYGNDILLIHFDGWRQA